MPAYRCYFLGAGMAQSRTRPSIESAENFAAEGDAEALRQAEALYRTRVNQVHGFELWQANKLVHRETGPRIQGKGKFTPHQPRTKGQSHER